MYKIKADINQNLLTLRLEGFMSDEELKQGAADVMAETNKLKPGFAVINDISGMKPASQSGAEEIKKAQQYVVKKGVSKIIRITKDPISKMQFNRTAKTAGYTAFEVRSLEEAMALVKEKEAV